jgi:hypothetical protein
MIRRLLKSRLVLGGVIGAGLAYFYDPDRGRGRRTEARDRLGGLVRRTERRADRARRRVEAERFGIEQRMRHPEPERTFVEDRTLADRIRSEAFGAAGFPSERVSVDVQEGVVYLRGQVERPDEVHAVEDAVRTVAGVSEVRNLLHTAGSPPPNKVDAIEASETAEHAGRRSFG